MPQEASNRVESLRGSPSNWLIVVLLAAILATQILILLRMPASPPAIGALLNARTDTERMELLNSVPLVQVEGGTIHAITGTVFVRVENTPLEVHVENTPLEVDVENMPLEVVIHR